MLVALGASSMVAARLAISELGSTVSFLAALLVWRRAAAARGCSPRSGRFWPRVRGLAVAAVVTVVLSLDATIVLLTPIVLVAASQLRTSPRPHVFACAHLANSASLLLPVANLTNLLAFHASGLSFTRFAALMALPWVAALGVEWGVLSRFFSPSRSERASASTPGEVTVGLADFSALGLLTEPAATVALWLGLHWLA